ncbi:SO2930 family diheme c-type cytochrome [Flavobacterium sp.]|uniref:SO2930 family diheme c-type cytochrome n=1 Tax=Flavobacterium sp. TaxID=239 RepID=UPI00261EF6AB|nr:SO2930 family diheme c-type cytochrome [Flavobacterium sp.]
MNNRLHKIIFVCIITLLTSIVIQSCKNKSDFEDINKFYFKEKLSDYNFFTGKLSDLHPAKGVVNYNLNSALFTDYSIKDRFIFLPKGKKMGYTSKGVLDFPDGTILIKNFAYNNEQHQKIMIETRLLIKNPNNKEWEVMTYLWNKEQTDAIKQIVGAKLKIALLDDEGIKQNTTYVVPNTNDCKRCHINNGVLTPIGPKARNLNLVLNDSKQNQLQLWSKQGILSGLPKLSEVDELPNWRDEKRFSLDQRARAYLDINCAHCHTKGGDAFNTGLFLEFEQKSKTMIGIMKEPVSAGGGAGGLNYDVIPGDVKKSILAYRMASTEPGTAMPELGRSMNHKEGIKLIEDWIKAMK